MPCDTPEVPTLPLLGCCSSVVPAAVLISALHQGFLPVIANLTGVGCGFYEPPYRTLYLRERELITIPPSLNFGEDTQELATDVNKWTGLADAPVILSQTPDFTAHRQAIGSQTFFQTLICEETHWRGEYRSVSNPERKSFTDTFSEHPWTLDNAVDDILAILAAIAVWPSGPETPPLVPVQRYLVDAFGQPAPFQFVGAARREASVDVGAFNRDGVFGRTGLALQKLRAPGTWCKLEALLKPIDQALSQVVTLFSCERNHVLSSDQVLPHSSAEWQPEWDRLRQRRYIGASETWSEADPGTRPVCCD